MGDKITRRGMLATLAGGLLSPWLGPLLAKPRTPAGPKPMSKLAGASDWITTYSYDAYQTTDLLGTLTTSVYDATGTLLYSVPPEGTITTYTYGIAPNK